MPKKGGTYVDNAMNRSLGRVGMSYGRAPVSRSSQSSSRSTAGSTRTYVDNTMNRSLGRVGMEVGSAPVSRSSQSSSRSTSGSTRTYVDNTMNRNLGRVGMEVGSAPVSRSSQSSSRSTSGSTRTYVDSTMNRSLGRVGMEVGSAPVSRSSQSSSRSSKGSTRTYVDNPFNRRMKRVGLPLGSKKIITGVSEESNKDERVYANNSMNRKLGRVGKPLGSMQVSRSNKQKQAMRIIVHMYENTSTDCFEVSDYLEENQNEVVEFIQENLERKQLWESIKRNPYLYRTEPVDHQSSMRHAEMNISSIIPFEELDISDQKLGHGGFGDVFAADWKGILVAVKKFRVQRVRAKRLEQFQKEVRIFSCLDHKNVVTFYGACVVTPNLCMVIELMEGCLYDKLHIDEHQFTDEQKSMLCRSIASGLEYLHGKEIAHCDMKSKNVLVNVSSANLVIKLTDFGLSMMKNDTETGASHNHQIVSGIGTPKYSAPEVLRGDSLNREGMMKADVYSLSLIFHEVYSEEEPYENLNVHQLRKQVGDGELRPNLDQIEGTSQYFISLLKLCWSKAAEKRPSMVEVVHMLSNA